MFAASKTASASTGGYQISRSLRFNSADSAYLNRTPASASNRTTWTYSGWVKRSKLGTIQDIFTGNAGASNANFLQLMFYSDDTFWINGWTTAWRKTTQVFRDVSAWYHIVVVWDTTQATAANRIKLYVNGTQVTSFSSSTDPALNDTSGVNAASTHYISTYNASSELYDGYMTEVNFIDGQALTPSSFGETNAQTGVWQPKAYSGSYGTNGFYLNFSDNSNTTAATLGKDYSGNGNNWTPNNFSVTAGAGNDSLVDSPTSYGTDTGVGGEVRGNYCTWNSVLQTNDAANTYANGNLEVSSSGSNWANGTISTNTGSYYFELTASAGASGLYLGINNTKTDARITAYSGGIEASAGGGSNQGSLASWSNGDIIGVAVNGVSKTVQFYRNGSTYGTLVTYTTALDLFPFARNGSISSSTVIMNAGQRPFAYTAPSGYKALCTQNLPTPTIGATTATQAGKYFNPVLYTGNGSSLSITGVGFQPDWTWIKARNAAYTNLVTDAVRGAGKSLYTNATDAETTNDANGYLSSFDSDGFSLNGGPRVNANTINYVAWNWKANGTGVTNTSGSITSTVSANTTSGFSIITWTGNATQGATIGHGLGAVPALFIIKNRSASGSYWPVKTNQLSTNSYLYLNGTNAAGTFSFFWPNDPTSSIIYLGSNADVNGSGNSMLCYAFAPVAGYSAFGSYTGNGSTDGTFVYFGFRPAYVMIKASNAVDNWVIMDVARNPYNAVNYWLQAESSAAEATLTPPQFDFVSNGLKLRGTSSTCNASGVTYIYMAFASAPLKFSLAR